MKTMKFLTRCILLGVLYVLLFPMTDVYAAPELTAENFDYDWYLKQHPDLAAVVPADDHATIWAFYQTTGEPAGWRGRRSKKSHFTKYNFDYDTFFVQNPDVFAAFGGDKAKTYEWYMSVGFSAGRPAQTTSETTNAIMRIYDISDRITNDSMSEREKVKAVHDWLCINVAYDYDNYLNDTIPRTSYGIEGPIQYGKSVCQGYAEAFEAFMDTLGIECELISGTATNSSGHTGGHAWNKVKINGNWYWIDVTWDDPVPDRPGIVYRYDYFLISEEQMNRNHTPNTY